MTKRLVGTAVGVLACGLSFALGCAGEVDGGMMASEQALGADAQELSFSELVDPAGIGTAGEQKTRVLIAAARRYQSLFGHAAPAEIDFAAGDAVIFYSAGVRRTGGYDASVLRVLLRGSTLHVTTQLESPGASCIVTQALSKPHVLAKVRLPGVVRRVRFHSRHTVRDCSEPPPFCGGIAGFPCPAGEECVDDPNDDCDPANGGADCGGMCVPITDPCATVRCRAGTMCQVNAEGQAECVPDPSTDPCATVRCRAGTVCQVNEQGGAECVPGEDPNPCATVLCRQGTRCELHQGQPICISDGSQDCGPTICSEGNVCCNFSCGICTAPGMFCTQQACL